MKVRLSKYFVCIVLFLVLLSCRKDIINTNLPGKWELIHMYHSDSDGDLLGNDGELIMIINYVIIDKYGGFIMNLLTIDEKIKGKFVQENQEANHLLLEEVSSPKYKGIYKYELFENNGVLYLNLESDDIVINARKNATIIKLRR